MHCIITIPGTSSLNMKRLGRIQKICCLFGILNFAIFIIAGTFLFTEHMNDNDNSIGMYSTSSDLKRILFELAMFGSKFGYLENNEEYYKHSGNMQDRMKAALSRGYSKVATVLNMNRFGDAWSVLAGRSPPDFICINSKRWGNMLHGGWHVCLEGPYDLRTTSACLVYSFGLSYDWSWDFDVVANTRCECHGFDHTISLDTSKERRKLWNSTVPRQLWPSDVEKKTAYLRTAPGGHRVTDHGATFCYHKLGIAGTDGPAGVLLTLSSIMERLGHKGRFIDYLKVDVEGWEWESLFENDATFTILVEQVKQLGIELHFLSLNRRMKKHLALVAKLMAAGFVVASSNQNQEWQYPLNYELVFLNSRFALT